VNYDAIVIGGGHNGLIAGCYLARGGMDVAVVEADENVGGMTSSGPLIASAPNHVINPCAVDLVFIRATGIIEELQLKRYGLRLIDVDPPLAYLHEDGASLAFWRDPRRTADEIRRFSAADAAAYLEFARMLDTVVDLVLPVLTGNPYRLTPRAIARILTAAVRRRKILPDVLPVVTAPLTQVLDEWFEHYLVKDAIAAMAAIYFAPAQDGGALPLIFPAFLQRFGAARPVGGMQALPAALERCFLDLGGTVHTGRAVEQIILKNGSARGVRLSDGTEITAKHAVIATCHPQLALGEMIPEGILDRRQAARVAHIPANADNGGWMKVDVALSGQLRLDRHQRARVDGLDLREPALVIGGLDDGQRAWDSVRSGELPSAIGMYTSIPTAVDPSQAPAGQDTLYLWAGPVPSRPNEPWTSLVDRASKAMVERACHYFNGIEELEIGRWVETPVDAARRLRSPGGSLSHGDFTLLRAGPLRPAAGLSGYTTPIPGLYLGSCGSHPGAGVHGTAGKLSAATALRKRSR
jgi:phytoene dehydrogenase-like protein